MVSGEPAVEFRHFVQLIAIGLQARIPMHMTGFPGVGKTEFTKSLEAGFDRIGIKCKVVVLVGSIREPQDFGGFPVSTPDGATRSASLRTATWGGSSWTSSPPFRRPPRPRSCGCFPRTDWGIFAR